MAKPIILAFALAQAVAGAAWAESLTVEHAQGSLQLEATPTTVMTTDWAAFDNLTALGIPVQGIPASNAPGHLADKITAEMQTIGSLQEPDVEAIAAAAPDLLVIAGRSRKAYPVLSGIVPTIDISVDNSDVITGAKANLAMLGKIFEREAEAGVLMANLDAKVAKAKAAAAGKGTALIIVTNGNKIGIYGPESRVSWLYKALEVPSVFDHVDDRDHGGDAINFEYLLKVNPDWLFVVDRDAGVGTASGSAEKLLDNELIHQTKFWQNKQIVYLDPAAAYITMNGYDALNVLLDQVTAAYSAN